MEYLLTYGWAILGIVIALLILAVIGAFSSRPTGNSCTPTPGYLCSNLLLNTTGNLSVTFSQVQGYPITITGIACTSINQNPGNVITIPSITLQSGNSDNLIFECPGAVGPIGSLFQGHLWMRYSTQSQSGQVSSFAEISIQVSSSRDV